MARRRLMKRIAREVAGEEFARKVWKRMELIGDIVLIKAPYGEEVDYKLYRRIAERILEELPYVKSVWLAASPVIGEYRIRRDLIHLAGEPRTETLYKEHGCVFKVDIAKIFITPRLSFEHLRIAKLVEPGEVVVNMFAGAGLFSIIIAKHARPRKVYSIDINSYAYKFMKENIEMNKVEDIVVPMLGDAAEIIKEKLVSVADRVLMPLPELAIEYLPYAVLSIKGKGRIHVYLHINWVKEEDYLEKAEEEVSVALSRIPLIKSFRIIGSRRVRPIGPRYEQVVVDVEVERNEQKG
ncbi:MAG: class I SAM-dependent methyltransferase family protein [Desulfurococcales archaeon]|nr:class I SAM-dependent methyltransferase family protein [Desulfurococcales archaeon]